MEFSLGDAWERLLADELAAPELKQLAAFVDAQRAAGEVYPAEENVFRAFHLTPPESVKAVVLGQDPYHEPGQAQGLAFYVPPEVPTPPSLKNIARELAAEYPESSAGAPAAPEIPDLVDWARQGVLLLNATLTVGAHRPLSHHGHGWEIFTDAVIRRLAAERRRLVYLLWGAPARKKGAFIDRRENLVLESAHPSPLSAYRGFFGNGHFRAANEYLVANNFAPIRWLRNAIR